MKHNGLFLVFEGVDGIGKSTQIKLLSSSLSARFPYCVTVTREPGGIESAEVLRELVFNKKMGFSDMSNLLLFNAARAENIQKLIKPSLQNRRIVICDRFMLSTLAYQSVLNKIPEETILNLHNIVHKNFMPDITIILHTCDIEKIFKRIYARRDKENSNTFDRFDKDVYEKINNVYKNYYDKHKNEDLILVNVDGKDIETIHCEIIEKLDELKYLDLTPCINIV